MPRSFGIAKDFYHRDKKPQREEGWNSFPFFLCGFLSLWLILLTRKKGQVAKSQDFPSAFTFIVSIATVIITAGYLYQQLAAYFVGTLRSIGPNLDMANQAGGYVAQCLQVILNCSMPIMILTSLVGLIVSFLIVGPLFSAEAMKLDLKRLNPIDS